jgi:hypothetical protein
MENYLGLSPVEAFTSICTYPHHKRGAIRLFGLLPERVRNVLNKNFVHVTDIFDKSLDPNSPIEGETLAFFKEGGRAIYLTPKTIFSEEGFMGLLAHEIAHTYVYHSPKIVRFFSRKYYSLKFRNLPYGIRRMYFSYPPEKQAEEYHADALVRKWGFKEFQNKLWTEMSYRSNKNYTY